MKKRLLDAHNRAEFREACTVRLFDENTLVARFLDDAQVETARQQ